MKKVFGLLTVLVLLSSSSFASNIPDFPFVIAKGEADINVKPNQAKISFELIEFNKDSKQALATISKRGQEIVALGAKYKINPDDITSAAYTKNIKRADGPKYQELEILGYEVAQEFTIEINDITIYTTFVDQVAAMENVRSINAAFDVTNRKEIVARLVKDATADAKQKATDLADGLGVKLDSVFAITQDSDFSPVTAVFGVAPMAERNFKGRSADMMMSVSVNSNNMFIPKSIEISKSVSVVYKIKP